MREQADSRQGLAAPEVDVVLWRFRQLRRVGVREDPAWAMARDSGADLHALLELVDRGCPAALAVRILAPLDGRDQR